MIMCKIVLKNVFLAVLAAAILLLPACDMETTPESSSPETTVQVQSTGFSAPSPASNPDAPLSSIIQAEIAGQWLYDFPQLYDPEIGFMDAITITNTGINGKSYLILSFDPLSGPNNSRVFIFDTADPLSPRLISTIAREKQDRNALLVRSAAIQNNILYSSLFMDKGLWMLDLSNPAEPRDLGIAPVGATSNLVVSGDLAYALGQLYNAVSISNISDAQNVVEVSRIDTPSRDCRLAVSGHLLFIGFQQTLTVVDISRPASPEILCKYDLEVPEDLIKQLPVPVPGQINWGKWASIIDLEADGDYVYVTFGAGQLRVIDVSHPETPQEVASADLGGFAIALTLKDNLLYVTKSDKETSKLQLDILDVSQPRDPRLLDHIATQSIFGFGGASFAYCWMPPQVIGNYVYLAGLNYMDIIKIR
jgi:hypothetical protein